MNDSSIYESIMTGLEEVLDDAESEKSNLKRNNGKCQNTDAQNSDVTE